MPLACSTDGNVDDFRFDSAGAETAPSQSIGRPKRGSKGVCTSHGVEHHREFGSILGTWRRRVVEIFEVQWHSGRRKEDIGAKPH